MPQERDKREGAGMARYGENGEIHARSHEIRARSAKPTKQEVQAHDSR